MKGKIGKKILEFEASINDIVPINPLFSKCQVRVLYTGKNRNSSIITKEAVEKALPTLKNIPIVGEYSVETDDFKGHGGQIDLDTFKYIHTTKPYGVVPESATYEWEEVKGKKYLTIKGCYLWTGRYEEAYSVIEKGKGQSMEIEVISGDWDEKEDAYRIDNFIFSALCILGDDVEPAFEDASITAYSLDKESFKKEFNQMLRELKFSLEKEVELMDKLLEKYSVTVEDLKAKGIDFENLSKEELEIKIKEVFESKSTDKNNGDSKNDNAPEVTPVDNEEDNGQGGNDENHPNKSEENEHSLQIAKLNDELQEERNKYQILDNKYQELLKEVEKLRAFKMEAQKADHRAKALAIFNKFNLKDEDIAEIEIDNLTLEEIEEKCYGIIGRKLIEKNNFSLKKDKGIHLPLLTDKEEDGKQESPYGDLFEKYN